MKKVVVKIRQFLKGWHAPVGIFNGTEVFLGMELRYTRRWSAKRGVRRFMKALGATNWRFADEPETEAEPAVKGVHPWARWEATDKDGRVWEYENKPVLGSDVWWINPPADQYECVRIDGRPENFATTLRRVNV